MNKVYLVITNSGDGSNGLQWVLDAAVIERLEELVDDGDESYASGDGLQSRELVFPDDFDLPAWLNKNHCRVLTMGDL